MQTSKQQTKQTSKQQTTQVANQTNKPAPPRQYNTNKVIITENIILTELLSQTM